LRESQKEGLAQLRLPTTLPASPYQQGGRLRPDQVAAFDRTGWPLSVGIGGRIPSDSAGDVALGGKTRYAAWTASGELSARKSMTEDEQ
jgi:hypothetical protein